MRREEEIPDASEYLDGNVPGQESRHLTQNYKLQTTNLKRTACFGVHLKFEV
jgi:hypothetical protein